MYAHWHSLSLRVGLCRLTPKSSSHLLCHLPQSTVRTTFIIIYPAIKRIAIGHGHEQAGYSYLAAVSMKRGDYGTTEHLWLLFVGMYRLPIDKTRQFQSNNCVIVRNADTRSNHLDTDKNRIELLDIADGFVDEGILQYIKPGQHESTHFRQLKLPVKSSRKRWPSNFTETDLLKIMEPTEYRLNRSVPKVLSCPEDNIVKPG